MKAGIIADTPVSDLAVNDLCSYFMNKIFVHILPWRTFINVSVLDVAWLYQTGFLVLSGQKQKESSKDFIVCNVVDNCK
jgi:hypothetical protein